MKIELRKLKISDAKALQKLRNDKKLNEYLQDSPNPYTLSDAKKSIKKGLKKDIYKFGIFLDNKLVGTICLENPNKNKKIFEVGYFVARDYWNKGIATKAVKEICEFGFKKLKLKRIWATIPSDNPASSRVLKKAGFKIEENLKCSEYKKGKYFNETIYARIKNDK